MVAKFGFDTAENEPSEICGIGSWYMYLKEGLQAAPVFRGRGPGAAVARRQLRRVDHEEPGRARAGGAVDRLRLGLVSLQVRGTPNFRQLVLGCIDADFCVQILIFSDFSRSTRSHSFAPL